MAMPGRRSLPIAASLIYIYSDVAFHRFTIDLSRNSDDIMLKSRNVQTDVISEFVPRRRFEPLRAAAEKYKRRFAVSTTLVVVLTIVLVGFVLADKPDRVELGVGKAGIIDTSVSADTLDVDEMRAVPAPSDGVPHAGDHDFDGEWPEGAASYYGDELAGRPTASGESFDPKQLTAAHRTLPFGTRLRVTNIRNGKSVVVRVNDRGPFTGNRALDLSYSAARQIGMLRRGTARVRMEVLK